MHVLVVEDERKTAAFIRRALESERFAVEVIRNGNEVIPFIATHSLDAIVMDIMLPGCDGLSVVRQMRSSKITIPVILLSARGEVDERIEGLNAGADDYLPKPFILSELIARVRALGRRPGTQAKAERLRVADLRLNTVSREAYRGEKPIELSSREYFLLEYLMRASGQICGRQAIMEHVWGYTFDPGTNLVDVYIRRLRRKIDTSDLPKLLQTIRGEGYVINSEP
jgi:DNA-binding response OmpR family regulator